MNLSISKNFLIFIIIIFLSFINIGCSGDVDNTYPAAHGKEGGIFMDNLCAQDGEKYGHTIILIDKTTSLSQAKKDFIKSEVFGPAFYEKFEPYTKFSYMVIDDKSPYSKKFVFSMCRPKAGKPTFYSKNFPSKNNTKVNELAESFENINYINDHWAHFNKESNKAAQRIFSSEKESKFSWVYESIINVLSSTKLDFGPDYPKRKFIIVSDLMQHSQRLSFYKICKTKYSSKPDLCPKLKTILDQDAGTKNYFDKTSTPVDENVDIEIIFINNREETKYALDDSLEQLWLDYFKEYGFEEPKVKRMLDVYHDLN